MAGPGGSGVGSAYWGQLRDPAQLSQRGGGGRGTLRAPTLPQPPTDPLPPGLLATNRASRDHNLWHRNLWCCGPTVPQVWKCGSASAGRTLRVLAGSPGGAGRNGAKRRRQALPSR